MWTRGDGECGVNGNEGTHAVSDVIWQSGNELQQAQASFASEMAYSIYCLYGNIIYYLLFVTPEKKNERKKKRRERNFAYAAVTHLRVVTALACCACTASEIFA